MPGCVHTDLLANGVIKDPFYRLNEKDQQWIEREEWEYRTTFDLPARFYNNEIIELLCMGLDTYTTVYLNEVKIISADNMFRAWTAECKHLLKIGSNEIRVHFKSPYNEALPKYDAHPYQAPAANDKGEKKVSPFTRKAPYQYGWDWGPRLLTSGIWRPIFLRAWSYARIENIQIIQESLDDQKAKLIAAVRIQATKEFSIRISLRLDDALMLQKDVFLIPGENTVELKFDISNPVRWWCNGLGKAHLYELDAILSSEGESLDRKHQKVGLRTIELIREPDADGQCFYFKLNGHPVFMRGANIIPFDYFPTRATRQKYETMIKAAVDANMNMLRAWGGAYYEDDVFYELCDENGILVWQDFMFACGMYPGDDEFLQSVRDEAIYNIVRLRNHPCLALWCGNNEILEGFDSWGWKEELGEENATDAFEAYKKLFYQLLPVILSQYDPQRSYWPSSPSSAFDEMLSLTAGDYHYWDIVKADLPIQVYRENVGRFMSEYGFKSYPEMKTLQTYAREADWHIRSEVMEAHQGWEMGADLVENNMRREYRKPKDFDSFLYVSQLLQAEAIRIAVEAHRSAKPYCMGTLYWQLNDCWPAATWSSIDYFGRRKALHYYIKRLFNPVLPVAKMDDGKLTVYVTNDQLQPLQSHIKITVLDFFGKKLFEKLIPAVLSTKTCQPVYVIPVVDVLKEVDPNQALLSISVVDKKKRISENVHYFVSPGELELPRPNIRANIAQCNGGYKINLISSVLAKNVYLSVKHTDGFFDDNYFELLPGKTKTVTFMTSNEYDSFKSKFIIRSLFDTYQ